MSPNFQLFPAPQYKTILDTFSTLHHSKSSLRLESLPCSQLIPVIEYMSVTEPDIQHGNWLGSRWWQLHHLNALSEQSPWQSGRGHTHTHTHGRIHICWMRDGSLTFGGCLLLPRNITLEHNPSSPKHQAFLCIAWFMQFSFAFVPCGASGLIAGVIVSL